jgi:hypothetical protein
MAVGSPSLKVGAAAGMVKIDDPPSVDGEPESSRSVSTRPLLADGTDAII